MEENFHEYSGLIYDGAYSEHLTNGEKKAVTGEEITEDTAEQKVKEFLGEHNIKEITRLGLSENSNIPGYNFSVTTTTDHTVSIAFTQTGGHIIYMNSNKNVETEIISQEEANEIGKSYLNGKGFSNMKETYYLKQDGIVTINYAYEQNGIIIYSDLIKVKIALDNGEVLGIETTGYLNSHYEREITTPQITIEEAKNNLNNKINIQSEGMAIIPTEWETEILCYEFKGKIENTDFLVYINAETGEEEDILIITNTPNGTLTM